MRRDACETRGELPRCHLSKRERAALAWTEALTRISDSDVPDALYTEARQHFSDKELVAESFIGRVCLLHSGTAFHPGRWR